MGAKMVFRLKLCFCVFLAFAVISSARNTISLSGGDEMMKVRSGGRSLKMSLDDYDEASANRGHDPKNRNGGGHGDVGRGRGGRN